MTHLDKIRWINEIKHLLKLRPHESRESQWEYMKWCFVTCCHNWHMPYYDHLITLYVIPNNGKEKRVDCSPASFPYQFKQLPLSCSLQCTLIIVFPLESTQKYIPRKLCQGSATQPDYFLPQSFSPSVLGLNDRGHLTHIRKKCVSVCSSILASCLIHT